MHLDLDVQGNSLHVRPRGDLDLLTAQAFREQVEAALERHSVASLVVHLGEVRFLDSSGLGALLGRYRRVRQWGGQMVLLDPSPSIRPVLEMSGIHKLMPVRETGADRSSG